MLPGTSSISNVSIIEQLIYIAGETSNLASSLLRLFADDQFPGEAVLDKFLRQDIALAKTRISDSVDRIVDYISSSRMDLIENREFYISVAIRFAEITNKIEDAVHRLLVASRRAGPISPGASGYIKSMVKEVEQMLFTLLEGTRLLLSVNHASEEILHLVERNSNKVRMAAQSADRTYKVAVETLVDEYRENPIGYLLVKEALDKLEEASSKCREQARDLTLLAKSLAPPRS